MIPSECEVSSDVGKLAGHAGRLNMSERSQRRQVPPLSPSPWFAHILPVIGKSETANAIGYSGNLEIECEPQRNHQLRNAAQSSFVDRTNLYVAPISLNRSRDRKCLRPTIIEDSRFNPKSTEKNEETETRNAVASVSSCSYDPVRNIVPDREIALKRRIRPLTPASPNADARTQTSPCR